MKILFLIPYPIAEAPSQRFRFEQYFRILDKNGLSFDYQNFLQASDWRLFYQKGKTVRKLFTLLTGFFKRFLILFQLGKYEIIFIHREITPIGPPIFEWIISKILKKKIVYDFDDAIWMTDKKNEPIILKTLKWRGKVKSICRWSYKISCGNEFLCSYARQFNKNVYYNPTTVDTEKVHDPSLHEIKGGDRIVIGWTGSHSTLKYLTELEPVLQSLELKYQQLQVNVISDLPPNLSLKRLHFSPWSVATEVSDLARFHIGIMPLPNDEWAKGKCGFKALQYMALQIPTVASPVGVNTQIIHHGEDGFLCSTASEWENCISILIEDKTLRDTIGLAGRKNVIAHYSISSNSSNFLSLFS